MSRRPSQETPPGAADPAPTPDDGETARTPPREEARREQEEQIDEAVDESFPASDPPAFVGSGGTDRPRVPDPDLEPVPREDLEADFPADAEVDTTPPRRRDREEDEFEPGEGEDRYRLQGERGEARPADDDRDRPEPSSDDLALEADDVNRGPFRPSRPSPGEQSGFLEDKDGVAVDPVYRPATPEVDVYEDLPSRRARVDPGDEEEDEDTMV
jgi:hypothetical protein